jgi:hypothetical protein
MYYNTPLPHNVFSIVIFSFSFYFVFEKSVFEIDRVILEFSKVTVRRGVVGFRHGFLEVSGVFINSCENLY